MNGDGHRTFGKDAGLEIQTVAVTGVGVMGAVIAQVFAVSGYQVRMHDISQERLTWAQDRIENHRYGLRRAVEIGKLTEQGLEETLGRLSGTTNLEEACDGVDLGMEVVPEDIALKIRVFRDFDRLTPPHAILASNTAGLPITGLAAATDRPEKVIGWHWFQPASVMKLAEIIVHRQTSDETRDSIVAMAERCRKNAVVVNDQPADPDTVPVWGFVANRIMLATREEARKVIDEGIATLDQVNQIMVDGFRWPIGPLEEIPE
jgi:3-hydroxyacyl-CoA dehydrogenase